ncbi:MAG: carbohydrate ABC transporter permease [Chloroflexota bacterium]
MTFVFFLWPGVRAIRESLYQSNSFGMGQRFVGLSNFKAVFTAGTYGQALVATVVYSGLTTALSIGIGLFLAAEVDRIRRGRTVYRTLFIWTYAVPSAVAGALWLFLFNPQTGVGTRLFDALGVQWNFTLNSTEAMALVVALTVWQQAAYNFLFFTAGLQAIPSQVLEAAVVDGAGATRRFWNVTFPLLSSTTFYLLVMNVIYVFFYTFGIIDIVTQGGPHNSTETLVFQVYQDGFRNLNTHLAGAETVLLVAFVSVFTAVQFGAINRRVHYR